MKCHLQKDCKVVGQGSGWQISWILKESGIIFFLIVKCHQPNHQGWFNIFRAWGKFEILHTVYFQKFYLLSQFKTIWG